MKIKVIFHIDESEKWDLLLTNVKNLVKGIDIKDSQVEIVANSKAVMHYKKDSGSNDLSLEELAKKGIIFTACNNALNSLKIEKAMIYSYVKVVPIGVKEIIEKQLEGYAYIKP
jgi:intracellular sulfur oxidation DsrE/DsrF family protein